MIPSQFQYRDLINHTLSGFLFILLFSFFIGDFSPNLLRELTVFIDSHFDSFGGIIIVMMVVGFVLSYVVGSMLSKTYTNLKNVAFGTTYKENNIIDKIQNLTIIFLYKILIIKKVKDYKLSLLTDDVNNPFSNLIKEKINKNWGIEAEEINDETGVTTFELCRAYVESQPPSLLNIDIERHFAHQLFYSRLTLLFLISFLFSMVEALNSLFNCVQTYTNISSCIWFLISIFVWFQARNFFLRTISNYRHWTKTIYYAFINNRIENHKEKTE